MMIAPQDFLRFEYKIIGVVRDCSILRSKKIIEAFKTFSINDVLDNVYASDEECEDLDRILHVQSKTCTKKF